MASNPEHIQTLACNIQDLSKTYYPSDERGANAELLDRAKELISAAQNAQDHATSLITTMVEAATIQSLISLKVLQAIPTVCSIGLQELANTTEVQGSLLERLLRVVVGSGFIDEHSCGRYAHTRLSLAYTSMTGTFFSCVFEEVATMTSLPAYFAARGKQEPDGEKATTHNPNSWVHGQEGKTAFEIMEQVPEKLHRFQALMGMTERLRPFTGFYDFGKLANGLERDRIALVDVGGADGTTVAKYLDAYPALKPRQCIVQDREQTIELAKKNPNLPSGVQLQAHDFFTPQPVKHARAYHVRAICHDWSDTMVIRILSHLAEAMAPDSKLLIGDVVLPEGGVAGMAAMMDMMMLCIGGKERTRANFGTVLEVAGLKLDDVFPAPGSAGFAIVEASLR